MNKTINMSFLNGFTGGETEKLKKYIKMFLQGAPLLLDTMKQHLKDEKWEDLKITAHTLKPQIAYMGISGLKDVLLNIEELAEEHKNVGQLVALINQLDTTLQKAFNELQAELDSISV